MYRQSEPRRTETRSCLRGTYASNCKSQTCDVPILRWGGCNEKAVLSPNLDSDFRTGRDAQFQPILSAIGHRPRGRSHCNAHELRQHRSGTDKLVYNPKTFAAESCAAKDALIVGFTVASIGQTTASGAGNSCDTAVNGYFDVGDPTPSTSQVQYTAATTINFNSATQTGNVSFTNWTGPGTCKGATFVPGKGATIIATGTAHFVISMKGARADSIITSYTNVPKGSNGAFLLTGTNLLQ